MRTPPSSTRAPGVPPLAETRSIPDYPAAIKTAMVLITDAEGGAGVAVEGIDAVGFKTVHAGDRVGALFLDDDVLAAMEAFTPRCARTQSALLAGNPALR